MESKTIRFEKGEGYPRHCTQNILDAFEYEMTFIERSRGVLPYLVIIPKKSFTVQINIIEDEE